MAAHVKELLFDLAGWQPNLKQEQLLIARCDLVATLQHLIDTKQVDRCDILCLDRFIAGERLCDIALDYKNADERLCRVLALIEEESHYTDELFLQTILRKYPAHTKNTEIFRTGLYNAGRALE